MSLPDLTQYGNINEDIGRWGYTICTVLKVAVEIVAAVTLVMLTYIGLSMIGADDPKTRTEMKAKMIQVFAGFCVVVVAVSFVNLLANGNINPVSCGQMVPGSTAGEPPTPPPGGVGLVDNDADGLDDRTDDTDDDGDGVPDCSDHYPLDPNRH